MNKKDIITLKERYIPRSLDVTEQELLQLMKESIERAVFSKEFIKSLAELLNSK